VKHPRGISENPLSVVVIVYIQPKLKEDSNDVR